MTFSLLGPALRTAGALLTLATAAAAEVISFTPAPLPDYVTANSTEARLNVITVEPAEGGSWDLVGRPGDSIGWGFKISWSSNVGDSITFNDSSLTGYPLNRLGADYADRLGEVGGNTLGRVLADGVWESDYTAATGGAGGMILNGVPGTTYTGGLMLRFSVYDMTGSLPLHVGTFEVTVPVSISVVAPEPQSQTITFAPLPSKSVGSAPFPVVASASSALPVTVRSLQPDLCTVDEDGVVTLLAAGTCTLVAEQAGNDAFTPAPFVYQTLEITKAPATVVIQGDLDVVYDGTDKLLSATTTPAGLTVHWRYNGEQIPPRAPGIYVVDALIEDPAREGQAQAQLIITDTSPAPLAAYADWLLTHFTPQEIQDGLVTARTADLAEDGTPNLLKYALGLDPWTTMSAEARSALPRFAGTGGTNALVFSLPLAAAGDLIVKVEASSDLVTWEEIARRTRGGAWTGPASVFTGTPDEAGVRAETLVTEPALPVRERRFYRLNIEFAP
ncbi:MAG: MBG domain-containing protein [Opitutaceae bacterium]|nr:MBG domain-containing protein [Opitutaceae bacterium]